MVPLRLLLLLVAASLAAAQTYVTPVVTRTETVQIKTQSRVTRVEIYAEDPRTVRMVTRHAVEYDVAGTVKPSVQMQHERKLPADAADTVTVSGTTLTRAQLVAFAVKFAEKDRADDLPTGGGTQVSMSWDDNSSDETGFEIERSTDGTAFARIATVAPNVTTYVDTTALASTTYFYRVRATGAAGASGYSNVASR